jgi:uncharacterized protein YdcH (DUF465 family)
MPDFEDLRQQLSETDSDYRRLQQEHQEYEQRLEELNAKSLLSPEDEAEEKRIKLHKLRLKDEMEQILREHARAEVSA